MCHPGRPGPQGESQLGSSSAQLVQFGSQQVELAVEVSHPLLVSLSRGQRGGHLALEAADLVTQRGGVAHLPHVDRMAMFILLADVVEALNQVGQFALALGHKPGDLPMVIGGFFDRFAGLLELCLEVSGASA